jgi:hypothetical protein
MARSLAVACTLVICASLVSGCGEAHRNAVGTPIAFRAGIPPHWLAKAVEHEARLFGDPKFHTVDYQFGKHKDVARLFGRFKTPPPPACKPGYYCPVPVRLHGRNLWLVVSTRTHRILWAGIGQRITHTQASEIAWHANRDFHIFPRVPGTKSCKILRGGFHPRPSYLHGRCTTSYVRRPPSPNSGQIRIKYIEVWSPSGGASGAPMKAGWVVTVRPTGQVQPAFRLIGEPLQLRK